MSTHPNAQLIMDGFRAFQTGDLETLRGLCHEGVVWHSPGQTPLSGDHVGIAAIAEYFSKLSKSPFRVEVHDIIASEDHAVMLIIDHLEERERTEKQFGGIVFNIDGGRVREAWVFHVNQAWHEEFWRARSGER